MSKRAERGGPLTLLEFKVYMLICEQAMEEASIQAELGLPSRQHVNRAKHVIFKKLGVRTDVELLIQYHQREGNLALLSPWNRQVHCDTGDERRDNLLALRSTCDNAVYRDILLGMAYDHEDDRIARTIGTTVNEYRATRLIMIAYLNQQLARDTSEIETTLPKEPKAMTHESLCARGSVWLQSNRRCEPVLYGNASTPEIPDVIGWSSRSKHRGSIVLECKASRSDFMRDWKKRHKTRMGDYRFIVCEAGLITANDIRKHCPDHGLTWCHHDRRFNMEIMVDAPRRENVNHAGEVELLRHALIHVSYNLAAHGCTVHMPTLTKWGGTKGLTLPGPKEAVL